MTNHQFSQIAFVTSSRYSKNTVNTFFLIHKYTSITLMAAKQVEKTKKMKLEGKEYDMQSSENTYC